MKERPSDDDGDLPVEPGAGSPSRRRSRFLLLAVGAVVLVAVLGAGAALALTSDGQDNGRAEAGASPSGPPADGGAYPTSRALGEAFTEAGMVCGQYQQTQGNGRTTGECTGSDGRPWIVMVLDPGDVEFVAAFTRDQSGSTGTMLIGRNWIAVFVGGTDDLAERAEVLLGGRLEAFTSSPSPTPPNPNAIPGDGTFLVPGEAKPGQYRTQNPNGACYWARLRGTGGGLDDIIANGNATGPAVVTIRASDKAFESRGCGEWTKVG